MTQRTATVLAQLSPYATQSPDLLHSIDSVALVNTLCFYENPLPGYTVVGSATVTIDLVDMQEMVDNKIESLKAEKQAEIAKHQVTIMQLDDKINQLLAIEYKG